MRGRGWLKPYPAACGWESCGVKFCGLKAAFALGVLPCAGVLLCASALLGGSPGAVAQLALVPQAKHARAERGPPAPVDLPQEFAPPQEAYAAFPDEPVAEEARAAASACQVRLDKIAVCQPLPTLVGPGE